MGLICEMRRLHHFKLFLVKKITVIEYTSSQRQSTNSPKWICKDSQCLRHELKPICCVQKPREKKETEREREISKVIFHALVLLLLFNNSRNLWVSVELECLFLHGRSGKECFHAVCFNTLLLNILMGQIILFLLHHSFQWNCTSRLWSCSFPCHLSTSVNYYYIRQWHLSFSKNHQNKIDQHQCQPRLYLDTWKSLRYCLAG